MTNKIVTKYKINVVEYDRSGYYYPKYRTEQIVIADSLEEAEQKAIERTPMKHSSCDWSQYTELVNAEDVVVQVEEMEE